MSKEKEEVSGKPYKKPAGKPVEWHAQKYDTFKLVKLGEYKSQKGSARSQCFELAKDGMLVGTWVKKCCEIGFEPKFPVNCVQKLMTTKEPGWGFSKTNAEGLTYEEVLHSRSEDSAKEKRVKKAAKAEKKAKKAEKKPKAKLTKSDEQKKLKGVNPNTNRINPPETTA